jgi:hypothetical protein
VVCKKCEAYQLNDMMWRNNRVHLYIGLNLVVVVYCGHLMCMCGLLMCTCSIDCIDVLL